MFEEEELKVYSEEVQDVLSNPPNSIVKWGNTILGGFFIMLLFMSYYIKYPDIVSTQVMITTEIPPEKIVAKSSGKIEKLFVFDKEKVRANTVLAVIDNPAKYEDVFFLKKLLDQIDINNFNFPLETIPNLELGDIENSYAIFEKDYLTFNINKTHRPHYIDQLAQEIEAQKLKERLMLLYEQKKNAYQEQRLKRNDLEREEILHKQNLTSTQEWEQKKMQYLEQDNNINILNSQILQLQSSINELNKNKKTTKLLQKKDDISHLRNVILSLNQLKKAIQDWELAYVLRSSIDGEVSFLQIWIENQNINLGENAFAVVPVSSQTFIGKVKAPTINSGKIKVGQKVNIRLYNYPEKEFGIVNGVVKSIALTPDDENNLLIDIEFPDGLSTSYKKDILFQQEMSGIADIITEDLRLIERLLYQFRDIFSRK